MTTKEELCSGKNVTSWISNEMGQVKSCSHMIKSYEEKIMNEKDGKLNESTT